MATCWRWTKSPDAAGRDGPAQGPRSWSCATFGGLSVEETAEALAVSPETVMRDWKMAKLWLLRELKRGLSEAHADDS